MPSEGDPHDAWWSFEQAAAYVRTHRPCRSLFEARSLAEARIADGTLPTRYRRPDQQCVPIAHSEWRWARDGGVFEWPGRQEQERLGHGGGQVEIEAAAVRRLYPPRNAPAGSDQARSDDRLRAEGAASFRLSLAGGVPSQADLERELLAWCRSVGMDLSGRTIGEVAAGAIAAYRKGQAG